VRSLVAYALKYANKFRTVVCDLLCDQATDGEAEKINLPQPQSTDKGFGVFRHAKVVGTSPVELATPALLKMITWR
jgi:hypothetical protein